MSTNPPRHGYVRTKPDAETASALRWLELYGTGSLSQRQRNLVRAWQAEHTLNHHFTREDCPDGDFVEARKQGGPHG
ncbi:hypothetical protein J2X72_003016 [Phyllobacterium sp. 1468]|nr:hypothetical protein [Phyllobacterium sp. 1468]